MASDQIAYCVRYLITTISRKCYEQSRNAQHERFEIPETPEPTVHAPLLDTENLPTSSNPKARLQTEEDCASVPWFSSGPVSAAPKVKQKKARSESSREAAMAHQEPVKSGPMLCDNAESTGWNTEDAMPASEHQPMVDAPGNRLAQVIVAQGSPGTLSTEVCQQPADPDNNIQDDNEGEATRMSFSPDQVSSAKARQPSPVASRAFATENAMSPVQEHTTPVVSSHPSRSWPGPSRSRGWLLSESSSQDPRQLAVQKTYTVRELAQIALVAANGKRMTVSDVVSWISSTFPEDSLTGAWVKSIQSAFSRFDEFDGDNLQGSKMRYGFSSKKTRRTYEQKFSTFLPLPSPSAQFEAELAREVSPRTVDRVQRKQRPRAVKTAERSRRLRSKQERLVHDSSVDRHDSSAVDTDEDVRLPKAESPIVNDQPESKQAEIEQRKNDITFNPFERKGSPPRFWVPQEHNKMHIRLTSFKEVYASPVPPTVDSMTEEEKAQKIAEIKARPSRKKFFGQENKLAHKRRHNLVDIHDEREGAWQNPHTHASTKQLDKDKKSHTILDTDVDEDQSQTLRQLFNLPDNMIPMNDGHTELAFRDGTLVSG
jgi:hypothetical protein